ncbi:MAG: Iron complex transport system substrate-binding protein [Acetothermia bacterium 64_32]|nr:MAG: Iron complex transport system substrate-binding protein [Acetothermia bacterium 64_32]HAF71094.1 hypothetical protein [Candidatus Acetothermia bacterium]
MRRVCVLLLVLALGLGLGAQEFPLVVQDDRGQDILIPAPPQRIVVAGTALYAEILVDLGAEGLIVGVADSPDLPPELGNVERIGPWYSPSIEVVLALQPDLVLGAWGTVRDALEGAGLRVLTTGLIAGLPDLFATVRAVGRAVGRLPQAEALIGGIAEDVIKIESEVLDLAPVPAAFLYLAAPDDAPYAAGAGSIEHELLLRAGGRNVFADVAGFPQVSLEEVIARDPKVIFTDPAQVENFSASPLLEVVTAVREGRIYGIKASAITSTRVALALEEMARLLHPEAFPDEVGG